IRSCQGSCESHPLTMVSKISPSEPGARRLHWRYRAFLQRVRIRDLTALAATVFRNRGQEGGKERGWGGERRGLPVSFVVKHGVENNEELRMQAMSAGFACLPLLRSRR